MTSPPCRALRPRHAAPVAALLTAISLMAGSACVIDRTGQSTVAAADREMRRTQERVGALEEHFNNQLQSTSQELTSVRKDSELNQVNLANSEALLEELLVQTQSTLGSLEKLQRRLADLESNQERLQSNMEFQLLEYDRRLAAIEQWAREAEGGLGAAAPPPVDSTQAGAAPPGEDEALSSSAATTVERARAAMASGKPRNAVKLLKNFEKKFPDSPEVVEARFLYAAALRQDGQGTEAIAAYQGIIESYPASPRVPEAMKAIGMTLLDLGEEEEARFFLGELVRIYPDSAEARDAKARLANLGGSKK